MIQIEIDDKKLEVSQGQMIIEAADNAGIAIPRFCYHKKLSIAANCRMCLVDVVNAPKALPACATPVSQGMKVYTKSPRAIAAQKAVMEFLLINHPLDCPICDQGGQCELQDVALEYGKDVSRYVEGKRVVADQNLGPFISTDMTRCIHCTRCVRFGTEVAGVRELGATGRGEAMSIGTFVESSVDSEVSGNVIDLCPVGALTSKPFRFSARAWELAAVPGISPHDCLGSNLFFHTLRTQKVMRALPRENETLNEVWLSDRDRFSYEGFSHADRLAQPLIKRHGEWEVVEWEAALLFAVDKLRDTIALHGADQLGFLAAPNSTLEEFYLLQKLARGLGCPHIDHRLRQTAFDHQAFLPTYPGLGIALNELETQQAVLLIGSDIRNEQPLIALRVRKAALQGAQLFSINAWQSDFHFPCTQLVGTRASLVEPLLAVLKVLSRQPAFEAKMPLAVKALLEGVVPTASFEESATALASTAKLSIILGQNALQHCEAPLIFTLSRVLAHCLSATWGVMSEGANSAGGWLAGALPHRLPMGEVTSEVGLNAYEMWQQPRKGYVLLHCEPEFDTCTPRFAYEALKQAEAVVVMSAYDNPYFREYADVLLPVTPITEMAGTYVNALGMWQSFQAAVTSYEASRPAWKVLRVLGDLLKVPDCAYHNVGEVLQALMQKKEAHAFVEDNLLSMPVTPLAVRTFTQTQLIRLAPVGLYAVDGITRRATALGETKAAKMSEVVRLHSHTAEQLQLQAGQKVWVVQDGARTQRGLPIQLDDTIPLGCALVASGIEATRCLGEPFGLIELIPLEDGQL